MLKGPYDIGLVEGSITTHHDAERIQQVRRQCKYLITIGACATAGGIQALRNWKEVDEFVRVVYATPQYISTLRLSTPIAEHVPVDFELRGCPINKHQLIELITATLAGRKPNVPTYSVCMECKRRANVCIAVAQGVPCLGPVTHAGCGALCPSYNRGCYGCYGPMESPNTASLTSQFRILGQSDDRSGARFPRIQCLGVAVPQSERGVRTHMSGRRTKTIKVANLARVEGEGGLYIKLRANR